MPHASKKLSVGFLFDDTLDSNDGVAQYVKTLGAWLSDNGHKVSYFVGETKANEWHGGRIYSLSKNVSVVFNGNRLSMPLLSSRRKIKNALKTAQPDVLNVQMPHSPLMSQRVINIANLPTVGTFHVFPANAMARFGAKALRLLYLKGLSKIDEVVSVSSAAQKFAKQSLALKTEVVPNMVNISKLRSQKTNRPMTVAYLGRLVDRKGCRQLIEAFETVHSLLPEARLLVGGTGPERESLEKLVQKCGLTGVVEFLGFIQEEDKGDFLAQASVACFPSLYGESFGIVLIEAMAGGSGVVLGGDNPGYRSVLEPRQELLFNPKDKQTLAQKIVKYLSDDKLRADINSWQKQYVKKFDVETVGPQMVERFHQAIAKNQDTRHN